MLASEIPPDGGMFCGESEDLKQKSWKGVPLSPKNGGKVKIR